MIHAIKIQPPYFDDVISGKKQFEIRLNDREYQEGDYLALNEWKQTSSVGGHYTGRSCLVYVDYILYGAGLGIGLDEDYCIMGIKPCVICKCDSSYWVNGSKYNAHMVPIQENPIIQEGQCNCNE